MRLDDQEEPYLTNSRITEAKELTVIGTSMQDTGRAMI
jgi:hypothetical protein